MFSVTSRPTENCNIGSRVGQILLNRACPVHLWGASFAVDKRLTMGRIRRVRAGLRQFIAGCDVVIPTAGPASPGYHCGVYRPEYNCKMRQLGQPFCAICRAAIARRIAVVQASPGCTKCTHNSMTLGRRSCSKRSDDGAGIRGEVAELWEREQVQVSKSATCSPDSDKQRQQQCSDQRLNRD